MKDTMARQFEMALVMLHCFLYCTYEYAYEMHAYITNLA